MGRSRQVFKCFRSLPFYDFQIISCKFLLVLFQKKGSLFFFLNGKYLPLVCTKCHFYRYRTGSGSHIIADGFLSKTKLGKGNASNLFLCHRGFSADEFLVRDAVSRKSCCPILMKSADNAKGLPLIVCQLFCFFYKNPFIGIGKILTYIKKDFSHMIFHKLSGQFCHCSACSKNGKHLLIMSDHGNQIAVFAVSTGNPRIIPGKTDF